MLVRHLVDYYPARHIDRVQSYLEYILHFLYPAFDHIVERVLDYLDPILAMSLGQERAPVQYLCRVHLVCYY